MMDIKSNTETAWGSPLAKMAHKNVTVIPKTLAEANALSRFNSPVPSVSQAIVVNQLNALKLEATESFRVLSQFKEQHDMGLALNKIGNLINKIDETLKIYE